MTNMANLLAPTRPNHDIAARVSRWGILLALVGGSACGGGGDEAKTCAAPNVVRYQVPGCGAEAQPICGSATQDAGFGWACGCDGDVLFGFDYFKEPWVSKMGPCPDTCFGPTKNLLAAVQLGARNVLEGCPCDPATDHDQCAMDTQSPGGPFGPYPIACVLGKWKLGDLTKPCAVVDAGAPALDGAAASLDGGAG